MTMGPKRRVVNTPNEELSSRAEVATRPYCNPTPAHRASGILADCSNDLLCEAQQPILPANTEPSAVAASERGLLAALSPSAHVALHPGEDGEDSEAARPAGTR